MIITINTNKEILINIENKEDYRISLDEYSRTLTALDLLKSRLQNEMILNTQRTITEQNNNSMIRMQKNAGNDKTISIKLFND